MSAQEHAVRTVDDGRVRSHRPDCASARIVLPRQRGLIDEQTIGFDHPAITGNHVSRSNDHDVSGHHLGHENLGLPSIAQNVGVDVDRRHE